MNLDEVWISKHFNIDHPYVIAGPCSAESETQVLEIAKQIQNAPQVKLFRAGVWKPRTRPGCFEGVGEPALKWLQKVKNIYNLEVTTEVAKAEHVEAALKHEIDVLWIGARTTANPFAVQEIADALKGVDIPVFVKNPINPDLSLWLGSMERLNSAGITKLAAIHRGFSHYGKSQYRNPPLWKIPIELKREIPSLPIISDPSHITGTRELIAPTSQKALNIGFNGLMIETHHNPEIALSDSAQQITPETLIKLLTDLQLRAQSDVKTIVPEKIEKLRLLIDEIDLTILQSLKKRMKIVKEIGELKTKYNITALQIDRMDEVLNSRKIEAKQLGLNEKFIQELFNSIHEISVKEQTQLMKNKTQQ